MSISFNPGQDVTVTLALSATDPETGPVELLYFSNCERLAWAQLQTRRISRGSRIRPRIFSASHRRTGDESCICAFLSHFGQGQRCLRE